jgi:hypothetical protein
MGRQVTYRMCPPDLLAIEAMLRDLGACFLAYYHRGAVPTLVDTIDSRITGQPMAYATLRHLVQQVELGYVEAQGYSLVKDLHSPVMELSGGVSDDKPTSGRLYYQTGDYVDRVWVPFDRDFIDAAETASRWIRRHFARAPEAHGDYEGPAAREWRLAHDATGSK